MASLRTKPRVLITHRYFWPENLSLYAAMLKDVAEWHVQQGHSVSVLTAASSCPEQQAAREAWARTHGVRLLEEPLPVDRGTSALARLRTAGRYAARLTQTLRQVEPDLAIVGTYPPVLPGLVASMARKRSTRLLYYVQDIAPEMIAVDGGLKARLAGWLLGRFDRHTVARADAVITLSEEMRQTLLGRRRGTGSIHVVRNYSVDAPVRDGGRPFRARPKLIFTGNQGKPQNLHHLLRVVGEASKLASFDLDLVGAGGETSALKQLAAELGLTNVRFVDPVSRAECQRRIEAADIGVVSAASRLYETAYPSKANSYLLGGLPTLVFAEQETPIAKWLDGNGFGGVASPTDVRCAANQLAGLLGQVRRGCYSRADVSDKASDLLSLERYLNSYGEIVAPLLDPNRATNELRQRPRALRSRALQLRGTRAGSDQRAA